MPPGSDPSKSDGGKLPGSSTSVPDGGDRHHTVGKTSPARADEGVSDASVAASGSAGSGLLLDARSLARRAGSDTRASDATSFGAAVAGSGSSPDVGRTVGAAGSDFRASSAAGGVPPASLADLEQEFFGDDP